MTPMRFPLLLLLCFAPACATMQERRCTALQDELSGANESCTACLSRLSASGDASLCQYVCAHSSTVAPAAVAACAPPAPTPAASTPEAATAEVSQ